MQQIIVILGPTSVGKTKLSVELAKKLNAEIINADSVAIYKRLNIGSAKPTIEEQEGIKHHLINIKDVEEEYNVFEYQKDCRKKIDEIIQDKKNVIIVGGTGLYIKAALYDYQFIQEQSPQQTYDDLTNQEILDKIKLIDKTISIHLNNRQRLVRKLNQLNETTEISQNKNKLLYNIEVVGLTTDREDLYERINNRVDKMIENKLLDEITSLKEYYDTSKILNSAIGYKEFNDYLFNNQSLEDTLIKVKQNSRKYAKRQYTFFNNQFNNINWYETDYKNFQNTINSVYNDIIKDA